jgi:hypothetical protein
VDGQQDRERVPIASRNTDLASTGKKLRTRPVRPARAHPQQRQTASAPLGRLEAGRQRAASSRC